MLGSEGSEKQIVPERQDRPENEHQPGLERRRKVSSSRDPLSAVFFLDVETNLNLKIFGVLSESYRRFCRSAPIQSECPNKWKTRRS